MSIIKRLRNKSGFTQFELAAKSGLSLRTIQRLEKGINKPKGHSLKVLSKVFKVDASVLHGNSLCETQRNEANKMSIKLINLSTLAFIGIPFGNLIFPFLLWRIRGKSKLVDEKGRRIINFQIMWSMITYFLLCVSTFIDIGLPFSIPLILIVLFIAMGINILVISTTAIMIQRDNMDFLKLPITLL